MSELARATFPTSNRLLSHILGDAELVGAVRELPAPVLGRLVDTVGLEDAAELVALASTEQLASLFDEDLWKSSGDDVEERFDAARFALWLHAFVEAGDARLVERLVELPIDLLTLAVSRLVLVVDIDALGVELSEGGEELEDVEKALEGALSEEWEGFRLVARDPLAWDDVLHALLSLDRDHHALLRTVLERCHAIGAAWIEEQGGLVEALGAAEMLESDVLAERDDRRGALGHVSRADARAFLELARREAPQARDPITKAYFRELVRGDVPRARRSPPKETAPAAKLLALVAEAHASDAPASAVRPALGPKNGAKNGVAALAARARAPRVLESALAALGARSPALRTERLEELAFLANVVASGTERNGERLRPVEALEAAVDVTNVGLEEWLAVRSGAEAATVLRACPADVLFRVGYRALSAPGGAEHFPHGPPAWMAWLLPR